MTHVTFSFDANEFPFHKIVQDIFECDNLLLLHEKLCDASDASEVRVIDQLPGRDQSNFYYKTFYNAIQKDPAFLDMYRAFIRQHIINSEQMRQLFLYQKVPTFRVHLPNNKAVGGRSHKDADYNHPKGEINYILPLTSMEGSSSMFVESRPGLKDFHFVTLKPGQYLRFNGNQCEHGNIPNVTGWTRVSFDFRILSKADLKYALNDRSVAQGLRFIEGEYYETL